MHHSSAFIAAPSFQANLCGCTGKAQREKYIHGQCSTPSASGISQSCTEQEMLLFREGISHLVPLKGSFFSNIQANAQKMELHLLVNRFCFPNLNPSCGKQKPIYSFGLSSLSSMYPFKTGKSRILSSVVLTLDPKVTLYFSPPLWMGYWYQFPTQKCFGNFHIKQLLFLLMEQPFTIQLHG